MLRLGALPVKSVAGSRAFAGCPFADIVKATAPAVAPHARAIVDDFYPRMFKNNPETKVFFNPANQFEDPPRQRMALTNSVLAYATNIDTLGNLAGAVEIIAHKHCALRVEAVHYPIVHDNLMASIGHILGDAVTPEIGKGWSEAVMALANILIEEEKKLYEAAAARQGGWMGAKDFKVESVREVATGCHEITFVPADGSTTPIEFTPGQFLTAHFKAEGATPRHYTITSAPGQAKLQCCVRKLDGGLVSGLMHGLKEGDTLALSPPFGAYRMVTEKPAVLIGAGIGVTPMKVFLDSHKSNIRKALLIGKDETSVPFVEDFKKSGIDTSFHSSTKDGRLSADDLVSRVQPFIADCEFYLCGPGEWLETVGPALTKAGASGVHLDLFGPQLSLA
eukprot:CAMPEP_0206450886 /NCGR_PEP_ID=MMETSP0324_2-20121206/19003_1 /ASSEMBLY_ACC=CAM_ASM_000836 /TAXON_ID=2866 /ORGANISM="Crypthecodinium cohnii, Strain Seligo" /LENGTH=392 /DNA_ID=CAMNT_0053920643 /DNA_START=57 /DNA_END=1235 /DNA_ORIENTATION=-